MPRPVTQADRDAMSNLILEAARRVLRPDAGVTLSGQPVRSFLAGSAPSNIWSKIQWDIGRATCRRWAAGKSDSILPSREVFLRDTCTPYITASFGAPGEAPVSGGVIGGQCPGVSYTVRLQDYTVNGPFGAPRNVSGVGPVIGPYRIVTGGSASAGIEFTSGRVETLSGPATSVLAPVIISITRQDGLPDTCGNRPATWGPGSTGTGIPVPEPIPNPPNVPWIFPGINVTLNPDGTITISFGDGTAPITIDPGIEPSFPALPPPGGGTAGTPSSTGVGGTAEGDAPSGRMLWGVKIAITTAPPNANQFAPGVYRGVCYVYMGDANGLDNDPAGATMTSGQMVLAERDYLTKWRVVANAGYNLSVTPYYKDTKA
jgi:hypothetical protein